MNVQDLKNPRPGDFCLLCGREPDTIGIFIPEAPEEFGGIKGKTRLIRYCLCDACQARPDSPQDVEKVIRAEMGVRHV